MSHAATLLLVWASFYGYAGAYFAVLYLRMRRPSPEHLAFACGCFALMVYTMGGALLLSGETLADGTLATRLRYLGGVCTCGFFVDLVSHLIGAPSRRYVLASYVAVLATVALLVGGLLVDPQTPLDVAGLPHFSGFARPGAPEPALRPYALVAALPVLAAIGSTWPLLRAARRDADARIVSTGVILGLPAGVHDVIVHAFGGSSPYLLEHAGLLPVVATSFALLGRFVRAGRELEQRTAELTRSYAELRETQEALVRKEQLAAVGELSAVIAHEVRNPLAVLKNAVSSLRRRTLERADRMVLLGILDEETDRLNRLVRDLLAYARPVAPKGASVEVAAVVERAIELARAGRKETAERTDFDVDLSGGPTSVRGEEELLRHAMVNVLDNALQAMSPHGGVLRVRAARTLLQGQPAAALSFSDTGEGMDTLVRAKALDPFFTTRAAGTGLGLAIVDRVVRNHGGALEIDSIPGSGTTVTLTLPLPQKGAD